MITTQMIPYKDRDVALETKEDKEKRYKKRKAYYSKRHAEAKIRMSALKSFQNGYGKFLYTRPEYTMYPALFLRKSNYI